MRIGFLVVAAGSSVRFGSETSKLFHDIVPGCDVLKYVAQKVCNIESLDAICFVINQNNIDQYKKSVQDINNPKLMQFVLGGETRSLSVKNGLMAMKNLNLDIVFVHDCARPLFSLDLIDKSIEAFVNSKINVHGVLPLCKMHDALKMVDSETNTITHVDRSNIFCAQTPQMFDYDFLLNCFEKSDEKVSYHDEIALVENYGGCVINVDGSRNNIKITTPEDMEMVRSIVLSQMPKYRVQIGFGSDVHKFGPEESNDFIKLLGVSVPYKRKLLGHSDADVGIHAIVDAILGSIGGNDIGFLFPDTDMKYKGMDSMKFLEKAVNMVKEKNGYIANVDVTITCEHPRINPHREKMKDRLREVIDFPNCCINIKGTTTEKLGALGRSEGILAQAVVTTMLID